MTPGPDKLLLVDDDANNRDMLSRRLSRRGYSVDIAEDAPDAMEKIRGAHYDLVLLDQMMPGMSGLDLLRLLRATYSPSDLPVIMVTATDQAETVVEALNGGANDYVIKPVDMPVVAARIEAQLTRSRSDRRLRESDQRHSLAAEGSNDGLWDWNLASGEMYYSPRWTAMLGYSLDELGREPEAWLSRIHPRDEMRVRKDLRAHLDGCTAEFRSEHRILNREGEYQWVFSRGTASRSNGRRPYRLSGALSDISVSKGLDPLTGLGNRRLLMEQLEEVTGADKVHATRSYAPSGACLLLLDLDGFKSINDSFGHGLGDQILIETGLRIWRVVAKSNFNGTSVSRIGGDEFTVLVPRNDGSKQTKSLADEILASLSQPFSVDGFHIDIGASVGMAMQTSAEVKPQDLLRDAELAMYRAKDLGKNRCHVFAPELRERAQTRMTLLHELRYAVERDQLVAVYQPKIHLRTRSTVGFEALLRWRHPELGVIRPAQFIPLAEESGLIVPIGDWILRQACRQLQTWQRKFPAAGALSMNVNLSVKQLLDPHLVDNVRCILGESGIAPKLLKLELTETALMTELDASKAVLAQLQALKVGLKLDDFGTGYSSLSYLRALHFDSLKIDRSFIARLTADTESHAIVETIVKLAHTLDMSVVAEGIEYEEQVGELLRLGCEVGQGFYFSQPVSAAAAEAHLTDRFR